MVENMINISIQKKEFKDKTKFRKKNRVQGNWNRKKL